MKKEIIKKIKQVIKKNSLNKLIIKVKNSKEKKQK